MVSGSTVWPEVVLSQWANRALASRLALRKELRKPLSTASGLSLLRACEQILVFGACLVWR